MNTNNKIILASAITLATMNTNALPFSPTDARAMGMGGTGVASAQTVHAVQFNPSLLSTAKTEDDFGILLPQLGGYVSDKDDFIDNADEFSEANYADDFTDVFNNIESSFSGVTDSATAVFTAIDDTDLIAMQVANTDLAADVASLTTKTSSLQSATKALNNGLASLSGKPLRGGFGGGLAIAIPNKKFAVAISTNTSASFSGQLNISQADMDALTNYTNALAAFSKQLTAYADASSAATDTLVKIDAENTKPGGPDSAVLATLNSQLQTDKSVLAEEKSNVEGFNYGGTSTTADDGDQIIFSGGELDPNADEITLTSKLNIIAVAISEAVLTFSREFNIKGHDVAVGISPKLQRIDVYDYRVNVEDEIEGDDVSDYGVDKTSFNLDIGASTRFGSEDRGLVGIVAKNLISQKLTSIEGQDIEITPQLRAGIAYNAWDWLNLAADLDLIENDPIAFEEPTQFLGLGAEADVFGFMQVRLGLRSNLAASDQEIASLGLGLSPFGLFHIDVGAYANANDPESEFGGAFELGVDW